MNDREIDHVTVLTITGEQYTFENIEKCTYDDEKEAFMILSKDGTLSLLPRESVVIFASVPKSEDEEPEDEMHAKIITLLDRPQRR